MDEERKQQYRYLKNGMLNVRSKVNNVIDLYNDLINDLKQGLIIDGEIVCHEKINENLSGIKKVKSEITNSVLVSINNKI